MTTPLSDIRYRQLKDRLRELFELDKSDLDFGIYRIMAARNAQVTDFLDRQLKDRVRQVLEGHGEAEIRRIQEELDQAMDQARQLGVTDPASMPKVQQLQAALQAAGGGSGGGGGGGGDLEADIYNHLLAFFSRYYDEGDFISRRRYKGDAYAIPYSGEEVVLHWANKDQYYIKSGEWHKDYRFKAGGKTIRFKLVEATQETGNNKESKNAQRRYILEAAQPIEASESELTLRFQFRPPTEDEKQAAEGAVAIFGGKYGKGIKGDEREQFCADAESRALAAMPREWQARISALAATETKPARTLLGKHLDHFTARNTFDYFIHKDLGGFLRRELDFYIKNEVVRLDDLENLPPDHLLRVQGRVKAIRAVAGPIIDFLAAIENFQKKMWLKKKFVLNTQWLATIDRLPPRLRDVVAASDRQWREWEALGFKPDPKQAGGLFGSAQWGTRTYLDACDKLVVDTRFFDAEFKAEMLASEDVLGRESNLSLACLGVLIHADNFQGLNILMGCYKGKIQTTYIDPPYNTVHSKIVYKNQFEHSSWLSLVNNTTSIAPTFWSPDFTFGIAIDDYEYSRISMMTKTLFPDFDHTTIVVNHHPQGTPGKISRTHEYFIVISDSKSMAYLGKPTPDEMEDRSFMRSGTGENNFRHGRPNSFYALLYDRKSNRFVGAEPPPEGEFPLENTVEGYERIYPINSHDDERVWRSSYESGVERIVRNEIFMTPLGAIKYRINHESKRDVLFSNWVGPEFNAGVQGTAVLDNLGLSGLFDYPKSVKLIELALYAQSYGSTNGIILDYFAGSGTTAHAVINLNRFDGGLRTFALIDIAAYFNTVLKPRTTKVIYSPDWKDGKAQSHDKGVSALVKYFALESYEDALNNLPAVSGEILPGVDPAVKDAMIAYSLDLTLGPSLLNLEAFRNPWGYTIQAQIAGEAEIRPHAVDLVETFNYLIGLKVRAYGPIERYSADFDRKAHEDGHGRLAVRGRLRRDPKGPFVFQRVEGELNDGNDTRVLVIWRTLTEDAERDAAALEAWMARHVEDTRQRSEHRDHHIIYINGPITLPQPTAEIRTVMPIEQTFKDRMFEDAGQTGD